MKKSLPIPSRIRSLRAYASARSLYKGGDWTFLDANEMPEASTIDCIDLTQCNRYPDPECDQLRSAIATSYDISSDAVLMSNGSDEIIDLLLRSFVRRGSSVAIPEPTYGMYQVAASTNGVRCCSVPLTSKWGLPANLAKFLDGADMFILCNPNNPTGTMISSECIVDLCRRFKGIVVVDEAYGEFADLEGLPSAIALVKKGVENLVVLRTFSKAFGGAGIRLGYAIASPSILEVIKKVKLPYNVNAITQQIGLKLWGMRDGILKRASLLLEERNRMIRVLRGRGYCAQDTSANFFLIEFSSSRVARAAFERLLAAGIITRRLSARRLKKMIRVTVGSISENNRLLSFFPPV